MKARKRKKKSMFEICGKCFSRMIREIVGNIERVICPKCGIRWEKKKW